MAPAPPPVARRRWSTLRSVLHFARPHWKALTIAFALMKPDGTLLSDAQASAESYSGSDTLAMAGTLVEEKADGVVNTLLGGYCANAASSSGKKRK